MSASTRVLVVEDSSTQRVQLRFVLEEAGFSVITAGDGDEALALARANPVEIIVSDVVMPGLDGFELCERIRREERLGNLPVILLTAMADPMDVLRALEAGADGFVRKPYDPEQLVARVKATLATSARRAEAFQDAGVTIQVRGRPEYLAQERLGFLGELAATFAEARALLPVAQSAASAAARVLIVVDSPTERAGLRYILEESGAQVTSAANGRDAVSALAAADVDVVVSDIDMPVMDGLALCRAIRADARTRRVPVILATTLDGAAEAVAALQAGATTLVRKPYDGAGIVGKVLGAYAAAAGRLGRPAGAPIELAFGGRHFSITADRMQMLDLLVASYDHTVGQNLELVAVRDELQHLNQVLEDRVLERTRELSQQVDERVRADMRRNEVEAQLRASQRAEGIGALTGGIAHDFNNLLSVIIGYTDLALEHLPDDHPANRSLNEAISAAERAAALVAQLLAFSRKQRLEPVPLSLNEVTQNATGMLRRVVGEDVEVVERLDPDLGLVMADLTQIQQVIVNIVANARDAMPAGGTLTIETANADAAPAGPHAPVVAGPCVMLTITDTGVGMDRETLERIFEPFYTTKEPGKGTGLGMATVHGIIRQSGGDILVESEPGIGTTLRIILPRLPASVVAAVPAPTPPRSVGGTETILIVEDEDAVRGLAARLLRDAGYSVLDASGPAHARELCQSHTGPLDLLLSDVVMPGMSGPEFAVEFNRLHPRAGLLFMSGYPDDLIERHGLRPGQTAMLGKPFTRDRLLAMVRAELDARR